MVGDSLYVVHRGTLYSISNAAVVASVGTLNTTSGHVDMATNGTELMLVDGVNGYIAETVASTFGVITDGDFPDTAPTVTYQGGRFIVGKADSGQFVISASYDGTAYDATEFATAESFPDDLVRVFVDHGQLILFGSNSCEFWSNIGALDFPYAPINGAVVEYGLAARWSVAKLADAVVFLSKNTEGQVSISMMVGYQPQRISNPDLEYVINQYSDTADAIGFTYRVAGNSFYQLNFPTAGKSWLYDHSTRLWSELEYGTDGARHRAEFGIEAFGRSLVFDYEDGNIFEFDTATYTDNGVSIARELIGRHIFDEETISISRLWLDVETGVGSDPQAMLSISKDGGHTYGDERWTGLGAIGEYSTRVIWRLLGQAYDWVMRIRIVSASKITISGAWIDAQ